MSDNSRKWECIGFEFPQGDEEYPDGVVKAIIDMKTSPVRVSKATADYISRAVNCHERLVGLAKDYRESLEALEASIMKSVNLSLPLMGGASDKTKAAYFALIQCTDGFKGEYARVDALIAEAEGGGNG